MDVRFYATLRPIVGGRMVSLDLDGDVTVRGLLAAVCERFPGLSPLVWNERCELGDFIKVFVDGREVRHLQGLETPVPAGAAVDIFPPVAGG